MAEYVGVGLIVASWAVMAGFVIWLRPKIVESLLVAKLEEDRRRGGASAR